MNNLEIIKLRDLKHLKKLPDLSKLTKLKTFILDNTGIKVEELDSELQQIVKNYGI